MSLFSAAERLANIDRSTVTLDVNRCLHTQDRRAVCEECCSVCPVGAITPGKPPSMKDGQCRSCLACLTVCPTGAYSADDAVKMLFNAASHVEAGAIELLCESHPLPDQGVQAENTGIRVRGCLAGLGAGALVALVAMGQEHILVRTDSCPACEWASLGPRVEAQVEDARHLLKVWNREDAIAIVPCLGETINRPFWDAQNPPLSRRDLFRMLSKQGQLAVARAMENGVSTSGRQPGRDRLRLLAAVAHLSKAESSLHLDADRFGFATISVAESCTACGACARTCPTEALQFHRNESETSYTLLFDARLCIGCGMCAQVCMPLSVQMDHKPKFTEIFGQEKVILREGELVRCSQCGALMAKSPESKLCSLCQYRRRHKFGSVLPPAFKGERPVIREKKL